MLAIHLVFLLDTSKVVFAIEIELDHEIISGKGQTRDKYHTTSYPAALASGTRCYRWPTWDDSLYDSNGGRYGSDGKSIQRYPFRSRADRG
jgi:hypothetical protein